MPAVTNTNAAVVAGNGLGPKTFVYAVATGTITMADAASTIQNSFGGTVAAVEGTADGNHIVQQGGSDASGTSGITLVVTFDQNPA
jgi:hypothetical protein